MLKIATYYTTFAIISTAINILFQEISNIIYAGALSLYASIFVGTIAGLVVKYILDKKYIFKYQTQNHSHNTKTFTLYTVMGVLTTIIFWGFELTFEYLYQTKEMRYLGGIIGLAFGYIVKYQLDKRFVFVKDSYEN